MTLKWYGPQVRDAVFKKVATNLEMAIEYLTQAMKINIGVQGPPRSDPFDFPHMDTQELNRSIQYDIDKSGLAARIGTDDEKASKVEFGEPTIAPRPFFNRTMAEEQDRVVQIMGEQ